MNEIIELKNSLPQLLLMENVPDVHGKKNIHNFTKWCEFLESIGYKNYWQDLNAKNYGIPQNRNRTFMVSVLGDYHYEFPQPIKLELRLKDMLETNVDEKYYINNAQIENIKNSSFMQNKRRIQEKDICDTLCVRDYKDPKCIVEPQLKQVGSLCNHPYDKMHESSRRFYDTDGIAPTIPTVSGGHLEPKILEDFYANREPRIYEDCPTLRANRQGLKVIEPIIYDDYNGKIKADQSCINTLTTNCGSSAIRNGVKIIEEYKTNEKPRKASMHDSGVVDNYRVRKLTPTECLALMGVSRNDVEKLKNCGLSNSALYKLAGNSIVVRVIEEIFKRMF